MESQNNQNIIVRNGQCGKGSASLRVPYSCPKPSTSNNPSQSPYSNCLNDTDFVISVNPSATLNKTGQPIRLTIETNVPLNEDYSSTREKIFTSKCLQTDLEYSVTPTLETNGVSMTTQYFQGNPQPQTPGITYFQCQPCCPPQPSFQKPEAFLNAQQLTTSPQNSDSQLQAPLLLSFDGKCFSIPPVNGATPTSNQCASAPPLNPVDKVQAPLILLFDGKCFSIPSVSGATPPSNQCIPAPLCQCLLLPQGYFGSNGHEEKSSRRPSDDLEVFRLLPFLYCISLLVSVSYWKSSSAF